MNKSQIRRKIEIGKSSDYVAEYEQRKKSQENHCKEVVGQQVTNNLNGLEIKQYTNGKNKHHNPEDKTDGTQDIQFFP
jgi:hypothetical protein